MYPLCMPLKRVETAPAGHVPQFDGPIPTRAGELGAIRGKSQSPDPLSMSRKARDVGGRLCRPHPPHPNAPIEAATSKQAPIWTPGQREDRTGVR